ncbi:hypothetical protein DNTS_026137 [Danionella cerebrum]|uniref:BRCT domain-containing protein n=1 Tax=Danionella cerebrum TaxID=2873325 RepID=A0A553NAT0_9TELE|nr:hypothetical protein DNTS_026137 [Danionella translucida]
MNPSRICLLNGMVDNKYIFQISGIKDTPQKRKLLQGIKVLGGIYLGGSVYKEETTHLIVRKASASEKFISACAAVTPEYVLDCVNQKTWLPEASYELNLTAHMPEILNPLKRWREMIASGTISGAFEDWAALIDIEDPVRRCMFTRILKVGKAAVFTDRTTSHAVTHVLRQGTHNLRTMATEVPTYSVSYIAKHLFGSFDDGSCELAAQATTIIDESLDVTDDISHTELTDTLKEYIKIMEQRQKMLLTVPEFYSNYTPKLPAQIPVVDFSNVQSLLECGFFPQALEEIQGSLQPGVTPPAPLVQRLMQHTLHGDAKPFYLSMFMTVLHAILRNNPTWGSPANTKYFLKILQCPECKEGVWPLLETSIRVCLESKPTCHSLPSPPSTESLRLHCNLQEFLVKLFQLELHAASTGAPRANQSSVLYSTFWNVWERSTLNSRAVQQLTKLLINTVMWAGNPNQNWKLGMLGTLQKTLYVVVEFWAQEHSARNSNLVEKEFKDLAAHIAILCQDFHIDMVSTYIKALGNLCDRPPALTVKEQRGRIEMNQPLTSSTTHVPGLENSANTLGAERETFPRGYHKVNAAGETLLHRACKRNQVETLLQILRLDGTDVNIKDYAGWTPLHEACNYGSTDCVQALLQHFPNLQLGSQVQGVSPLHDALLNQHTEIGKMLLRHGGSALLQLCDHRGQTPLDLVSDEALRQELLHCAEEGDKALNTHCLEVQDPPFIESCSLLLSCLLLTYLQERHIPDPSSFPSLLELSPSVCRTLIRLGNAPQSTNWRDSQTLTLVQDLRTLLNLKPFVSQISPALRQSNGYQSRLLVQLLEDLQDEGQALMSGQSESHSF